MQSVTEGEARAYYAASLVALRFLEAQRPTGRRFGADADARWKAFEGDLKAIDRIDLLIRDADAHWPRSFGARTVFDFTEVAEDEAFGALWPRLDPVEAATLWRRAEGEAPETVGDALKRCAQAWELALETVTVEPVSPSDKLVAVGATPPAHRQVAAVTGALLNAPRACPVISSARDESTHRRPGGRLRRCIDGRPRGCPGARGGLTVLSDARFHPIGETSYAHEQEAVAFARQALPNRDPFHMWALFELAAPEKGRSTRWISSLSAPSISAAGPSGTSLPKWTPSDAAFLFAIEKRFEEPAIRTCRELLATVQAEAAGAPKRLVDDEPEKTRSERRAEA